MKKDQTDHAVEGGGIDRRKHRRFMVEVTLEDIFSLGAFVSKERGRVMNISAGGMAMVTRGTYKPDSQLVFSFMLPNGMRLKDIKGTVMRVEKEEGGDWFHGIEFTELGLLNKIKLKWFLYMSGE